jgi:Ca-activated chloride channel family protein
MNGTAIAPRVARRTIVTRFAIVPGLLLALTIPTSARQAVQDPAATVFRTGANLVALNVTVTDQEKRYVSGLTVSDFAVYEDGVRQQVQFFDSRDVPIDLIVLLDASSSMADKMEVVHEAASSLVKQMRPEDRGAVVNFADTVTIRQPLTADRSLLESAIRSTQSRGATSLHNAIYIAIKEFGRGARAQGAVRRQAIVVLSDGDDTASLLSFEDVLAVARRSGVSIYTIALQSKYTAARLAASGQRRYFSASEFAMKSLAQETGAQSFFPQEAHELRGVYATIADEVSNQYSLAYEPSNSRLDGRYRRIVVRVTSRPELRLRTRTGYSVDRTSAAPVNYGPLPR